VNQWLVASFWVALALAAGLISVRTAISVSLLEIAMGVIGGNVFHLHTTDWTNFLAGFGAILLTFMAGAEINPDSLRKHLRPSLAIGFVGFLFPFLGAWAFARWGAHWDPRAAQIAGISLSTTSVAVVYAVMVETGLNETELGKLILAACFVNDLGTVLALGVIFANYNLWLVLFAVVATLVLVATPRLTRWVIARYGAKVSELEIKFVFLLLLVLGGLASLANSEPVLPAYLLGLVIASVFSQNRDLVRRLRTVVFGLLTPFYFLKAGLFVLLPAVWAGAGLIGALFLVKMASKLVGIWPLTRVFQFGRREGNYTTLLMSTGLTFGTISALFGLTRHIITQSQYTILVTVVIGSAVIPTLIAQAFFRPAVETATVTGEAHPQLTEAPEHAA
jgi:Kef-type K+ transport system membrane component KefB